MNRKARTALLALMTALFFFTACALTGTSSEDAVPAGQTPSKTDGRDRKKRPEKKY